MLDNVKVPDPTDDAVLKLVPPVDEINALPLLVFNERFVAKIRIELPEAPIVPAAVFALKFNVPAVRAKLGPLVKLPAFNVTIEVPKSGPPLISIVPVAPNAPIVIPLNPVPNPVILVEFSFKVPEIDEPKLIDAFVVSGCNCNAPVPVNKPAPPLNAIASANIVTLFAPAVTALNVTEDAWNVIGAPIVIGPEKN